MKILKSFEVVLKFSFALICGTVFTIGMIINNETVAGISGTLLIALVIYRKIDQLHKQYSILKQIPRHIRDMVAGGDITNIYKEKEPPKNSDNRGTYQ